jgi:glycosyltransferase involved in cell wall biosynthesis
MKIIYFSNSDWYLYNFRLALAKRAVEYGLEVTLVSPRGNYVSKLIESGFNWVECPMDRKSINPIKEAYTIYCFYKIMRKSKPDIVHGFTTKCAIYGAIASKFAKTKMVIGAIAGLGYSFSSEHLKAKILRLIIRHLLRYSFGGKNSHIVLQNTDDFLKIRNIKCVSDNQLHLIKGSGVNVDRFNKSCSRTENSELIVLMASRLLWQKGVREYCEAAKKIRATNSKIKFILAGDLDYGNPDSVPRDYINDQVKQGNINWIGHVEKLEDIIRNVHVMVLATTYGEGVPRSLIEGASAQLGLIATRTPGCTELIDDNKTGLLIQTSDVQSLISAINKYFTDENLRKRCGIKAREKVITGFSERIVIEKTISLYQLQ